MCSRSTSKTSYDKSQRRVHTSKLKIVRVIYKNTANHLAPGPKLLAYQISNRYLNPRPRYYYFRFLKINGCHIEILLPVSILTVSLSLAYDSVLAYRILCKLDNCRRIYDVMSISQNGGHGVVNLLPVSGLAMSQIVKYVHSATACACHAHGLSVFILLH